MAKKYSMKFWIIFWTCSAILLGAWYGYLEFKKNGIQSLAPTLDFLPFLNSEGSDYKNAAKIADYILKKDGKERTFLVLFQNNMEIRPGGGFIGSFGVLKIKDGEVMSIETHDLSNFDGRIPDTVKPPYPMEETLRVKSWKLRDSNYSPDFEVNANKAEEFYYMGQGQENFDGVIGITTNVFTSILKITGPIKLPDYPGTYDSENGVITLEYQVEKAFEEQGIDRGERKSVMNELAEELKIRVSNLSINGKIELAKVILNDLNKKDIQLYFKNPELQNIAMDANWAGLVDSKWTNDYLLMIDANLGSFKSDYYVNRSVDYTVDFSKEEPIAKLAITYKHTAKQKDWMTRDYFSYLRVYVPEGAWLLENKNFENPQFGSEFGKKFFGGSVRVPIGQERTVELTYKLPRDIKADPLYDLKIQKQAGILDVPVSINIIGKDGFKRNSEFRMNSDVVLSELEK